MSLFRPLVEWPLLICGPILRRVTPDSVSVFVATSAPCRVELIVTHDEEQVAASPPTDTRTIGALLQVSVVTAVRLAGRLTPDVVYAYDVRMTPQYPPGPQVGLADQPGLLTGSLPLGYKANLLPTFSLPPGQQHLHIVHSSCRKPHGGGPDALAMVDSLIAHAHANQWITNTVEDARRRPHHLLLTGDQIYADDVAVSLLPVLMDVGGLLLGELVKERFPGNILMTNAAVKPGPSRRHYLERTATLTSTAMENHLMYFAEFCAMYVMAWSDELWARDAQGLPQLDPLDPDLVYPRTSLKLEADSKARKRALTDRAEVLSFADTVRRVRRAMANVPTMMMFDDHEVSDDWNLNLQWVQASRWDPATHQIVRNGLLAYALFQAWGNTPDRFETGPGESLLDLLTVPSGKLAPPLATAPAAADVLLDIAPAAPSSLAQRVTWDWTLDGPEHRVIALDTRTHRDYVTAGPNSAGLLTSSEMTRQLSQNRPDDPTTLVYVIAPAPVTGHPLLEEAVQPLMAGERGGEAADHEAWAVNRTTYEEFLRRLSAFGRVVLLSGDVHYGYTNHTAYFGAAPQQPARFVQLCSSAAKNADKLTRLVQAAGFLGLAGRSWFGFSTPITDDDGAHLRTSLKLGTEKYPFDRSLRDLYFRLIIEDRLSPPPVIPAGPWFTELATTTVDQIVALARPDDWAYRITYVRDVRTRAKRHSDLRVTTTGLPTSTLELVADLGVTVVGEPNIGQVRLRMVDGVLEVVHRLHWLAPPFDLGIVAYTEHSAPLTRPTPAERPAVFRVPEATQ